MGLFDFFKTKAKYSEEPIECYIKDDFLYYKDHVSIEMVDLNKVDCIYANMLGPDSFYLVFFDYKQHYINTNQSGYNSCFEELKKRFPVDLKTYERISNSKTEIKAVIWRKKFEKNYKIISTDKLSLAEGFEVLSTPPQLISWDTTYEDFLKLNVGHLYENEMNINYYKFDYPVRIGAIILNNFEFYFDNNRKDIAVQSYFSDLYDDTNTDKSFDELKNIWLEMIPTDLKNAGYEREDQRSLSFKDSSISYEILYTYNVDSGYDKGNTFFYIRNERNYRDLILKSYKDIIEPDQFSVLKFENDLNFIPKYEYTPHLVLNPNEIDSTIPAQLWYDKVNKRIGFTDEKYAIVYNIKDIRNIVIQNVLPAKGGGYAELIIDIKEGYPESIYYAELNSLDQYASQIEQLTKVSVILPEPYYNC